MQKEEFHFVVDIGCGSGLSSRILSREGLPWVGTDISLDMLSLAQTQDQSEDQKNSGGKASTSKDTNTTKVPLCKGHLTASDMSQGLPFRPYSFDFAISISAVQWLCYNKTCPEEAAQRFFNSVWRCLRGPESRAAFQVYVESKFEFITMFCATEREKNRLDLVLLF